MTIARPLAAPEDTPRPPHDTAHPPALLARIVGVVLRPRATMQFAAASHRWAGVLAITTAAAVLTGVLVMETGVGQQALVDQWERTAAAFGQPVGDAQYARLIGLSRFAPIYAAAAALATGPGLALAVAGLLVAALGGRRTGVSFGQVLAVVAHAGVILALRQVIAAPLVYARETTASTTTIGFWFPTLDEGSALAGVLGSLDVFVLWWIVVLAVGIGALYGRRPRTVAAILGGVYAALALIVGTAMALS